MKKDINELLKHALTPTQEPDFWLNQKILNQIKETNRMDGKKMRRIPAAAIAAAVILGAGTVTAYAAWKYKTPDKMAESFKDYTLMEAFQGGDAITINERQSYGGYNVTLLGIVSGKNISQFVSEHNGVVEEDRTYTAVAIENADGTPMPDTSEDAYADLAFCVSPLIKGYDPNWYNVITMRGGYSEFQENGILYRLVECDNVEVFADHGLYLCVSDGTFYNQEAYRYDEATGEITRNEDYTGLNALFQLPIDASKADPKAAAEYLTSLEESEQGQDEDEQDGNGQAENLDKDSIDVHTHVSDGQGADLKGDDAAETEDYSAGNTVVDAFMQKLTPDNIDQYAKRIESTVQKLTPDEDGMIHYAYDLEGHGRGSGSIKVDFMFPDGKTGMSEAFGYDWDDSDSLESVLISTYELLEDGTVVFAMYEPKLDQA